MGFKDEFTQEMRTTHQMLIKAYAAGHTGLRPDLKRIKAKSAGKSGV